MKFGVPVVPEGFVGKERGEGDLADSNSTVLKEMATGTMK
jgi:hypothetical protein